MKKICHYFLLFLLFPYFLTAAILPNNGSELRALLLDRYGEGVLQRAQEDPWIKEVLSRKTGGLNKSIVAATFNQIEEKYPFEICRYCQSQLPSLFSKLNHLIDRERWQLLTEKVEKIEDLTLQSQLYFQIFRSLSLSIAIEGLDQGTFLLRQRHFFESAVDLFFHNSALKKEDYPTCSAKPFIYFLFDQKNSTRPFPSPPCKGEVFPVAVFKENSRREAEETNWELSCLLGLDAVFVPAMRLIWEGNRGIYQQFAQNDLKNNDQHLFYTSLHSWINTRSYIQSALAVLFFALGDMHQGNMVYQLCDDATLHLKLIDTTIAFDHDQFLPCKKDGWDTLLSPMCWVGWDNPQTFAPLPKKERNYLKKLVNRWKTMDDQFEHYLAHPLTSTLLTRKKMDQAVSRCQTFCTLISKNEDATAIEWLETVVPQYKLAQEGMKRFFPEATLANFLFLLTWNPDFLYQQLSPDKQRAFADWISCSFCPEH